MNQNDSFLIQKEKKTFEDQFSSLFEMYPRFAKALFSI